MNKTKATVLLAVFGSVCGTMAMFAAASGFFYFTMVYIMPHFAAAVVIMIPVICVLAFIAALLGSRLNRAHGIKGWVSALCTSLAPFILSALILLAVLIAGNADYNKGFPDGLGLAVILFLALAALICTAVFFAAQLIFIRLINKRKNNNTEEKQT